MRMKEIIGMFITFLVMFTAFTIVPGDVHGGTATSWAKYVEIHLENMTTNAALNYAGNITMPFLVVDGDGNSGYVKYGTYQIYRIYVNDTGAFPGDLRFCAVKDPTQPLPQFIQHYNTNGNYSYYGGQTLVFVRIPSGTKTIYLFYDNPDAQVYSTLGAFNLGDDFQYQKLDDLENYYNYGNSAGGSFEASVTNNMLRMQQVGDTGGNIMYVANKKGLSANLVEQEVTFVATWYEAVSQNAVFSIGLSPQNDGFSYSSCPTVIAFYPASPDGLDKKSVFVVNNNAMSVNFQTQESTWYTVILHYANGNATLLVYKNNQLAYNVTKIISLSSTYTLYPAFWIKSYDSRIEDRLIDWYGVLINQNVQYRAIVSGYYDLQTDKNTGGNGGAGLPDFNGTGGIMGYLHSIASFILSHMLTTIFAVLAAAAFFNGKFKIFFIFAALAIVSYFYLDAQVLGYLHNVFGGGLG